MTVPLLETRGLAVGYTVPLVTDADLRIEPGEIVALIGPNGSGKSTILRTIAGLVPPLTGSIEFKGIPVNGVATWRRVRDYEFGFVAQESRNSASLSVRETLHLAMWSLSLDVGQRRVRLHELLADELFVRLEPLLDLPAASLSGGEDLILALAKCMVRNPVLLLLDEPSAGLAEANAQRLAETLRHISKRSGLLLAEQSLSLVFLTANRIYLLRRSQDGTAMRLDELAESDRLNIQRSFLTGERSAVVSSLTDLFR